MKEMLPLCRYCLPALLLVLAAAPARAQAPEPGDSLDAFVAQLEQALLAGEPQGYLDLVGPSADQAQARAFAAANFRTGVSRAVLRERDRALLEGALPGHGFRLLLTVFTEDGHEAQIATWRLDVLRVMGAVEEDSAWQIVDQQQISSLDRLYRLRLNEARQYIVRDLTVRSEDVVLRMSRGTAFAAEVPGGMTALVLLGRGELIFSPAPAAERGQVRIFAGSETLRAGFRAAFIRLNPHDIDARLSPGALTERPQVNARDLRRALQVFDEHVEDSFGLELGDLSPETWSLVPAAGDFLADVQTRRRGNLTYARSRSEPEDISLFDRRRRRTIASYPSAEKLASRGRFYHENELVDYDVQHYDVEASFWPERDWIRGRTTVKMRVRAPILTSVTLRLAESLTVLSVSSEEFGRLIHLKARGQNSIIVGLPTVLARDEEFSVAVAYAGRVEPQALDREAVMAQGPFGDAPAVPVEPRFIYSNRNYWYPQSIVTDYATATMRLTVPEEYAAIASGELVEGSPVRVPDQGGGPDRKLYVFASRQPVRYLACAISRFSSVESAELRLTPQPVDLVASATNGFGVRAALEPESSIHLAIQATPRQQNRARDLFGRTSDMLRLYTRLVGDAPYPAFTLAVSESHLPGGHSPAYFAILNQPVPRSRYVWRHDPVSFDQYPPFFLAHELAHQWWGQAVGWKNYREQWLSEGFAQYFAALYARHDGGEETFSDILRQMRRSALERSHQGPIALGYRLGHIRGESRVFRSLVYNKSALVLHMLRRLVGDEAFFSGVRRFYAEWRFRKAGTDDLQRVFEAEAGRTLNRFFDRWIFGDGIPRLRFTWRALPGAQPGAAAQVPESGERPDGPTVLLRFEQLDEIYDVPVTVTLTPVAGEPWEVIVPVTDRITEVSVPVREQIRRVDVNRDHAALARFVR